jgi:hypothetical protein
VIEPEQLAERGTIRGTQSFVHTMSACWKRPSLTALEVLWRWVIGIPALALMWLQATRVVSQSGADLRLLKRISLADPVGMGTLLTQVWDPLRPGILRLAEWLVPALLVGWVLVSALGRTLVLRRMDRALLARPVTFAVLQGIRVAALVGSLALWFELLQWSGQVAVARPIAAGGQPNAVLYAAMVIAASLGLFAVWAGVSWLFSMAPLIAMLRGAGPAASLAGAARMGPLRAKLVEINLVMGIVKIALIVLAMVASASPLPFQTIVTPDFMMWWYAGVLVVYCLASDFFHVVRLAAYIELWRVYES